VKVRVLPGNTIVHGSVAYTAGDEFEIGDPSLATTLVDADQVEVIPPPPLPPEEDPDRQAALFLLGRKITGIASDVATGRDHFLRRHKWISSIELILDDGSTVTIHPADDALWLEREPRQPNYDA
jgi:hypothetical protein